MALANAGSELVRVTVNTEEAAAAVPKIVETLDKFGVRVPVIGDFHYNGHLLLKKYPDMARALAKYRINPGNVNIGKKHDDNFRVMIEAAMFLAAARIVEFGNIVTMQVLHPPLSRLQRAAKRAFDVVVAAAGLVILSPLLAIVAMAIKLDSPGPILFRNDGLTILAGLPATREIVTLDAATGGLLNRLPLAIAPQHFCFNPDGGQMFVTGSGLDALVIANPYQNEIDQTISAGHQPGAMAVQAQQNILLVANPSSGNVTLLDIDTRRLGG